MYLLTKKIYQSKNMNKSFLSISLMGRVCDLHALMLTRWYARDVRLSRCVGDAPRVNWPETSASDYLEYLVGAYKAFKSCMVMTRSREFEWWNYETQFRAGHPGAQLNYSIILIRRKFGDHVKCARSVANRIGIDHICPSHIPSCDPFLDSIVLCFGTKDSC